MTVATFLQSDYNTQSGTAYPLAIDGDIAVLANIAGQFAPHEAATPDMTLVVDAGAVFNGTALATVAQQVTATFTVPGANSRIDRVVIDQATGAVSVIAGTSAASPTPPAIAAGKIPVAQVLLTSSSTSITNSMITDERQLGALGLGTAARYQTGTSGGAVPLLNGANTWSGTATFSILKDSVQFASTAPGFVLIENGGSIDNARWDFFADGEVLSLNTTNDSNTVAGNVFAISRSTTNPVAITIPSAAVVVGSPTGGAKGAGTINAAAIYQDGALLLPPGVIAYHAGSTPPAGWLVRDGSAISRTTYAALFAVVGTTYGAGDGSTSFNLPDDRGEFLRGWDGGRGVDSGRVFGSWQADDFKSHTHLAGPVPGISNDGGVNARNWNISSTSVGTSSATGGSETRPRNRAYLPIIKY